MTQENNELKDTSPSRRAETAPASVDPEPENLKEYFDQKLHPILSAALAACARERPENPAAFVGQFLLDSCK